MRGAHRALSVVHVERTVPLVMTPHTPLAQVLNKHFVVHGHHLIDSTSPFFLYFSFLSISVYFLQNELFLELDNLIAMESLCYSAKGSEDAYDVSTSLTSYEPNFVTFGELNESSGPFSFMIPSSDQDMDDVTLGKMLTEAHRGQADYCHEEEKEEGEVEQEVEGEKEEEHSNNNAHVHGWDDYGRQVRTA